MSVNIPQPFVLDGGIDSHLSGGVDARMSGAIESRLSGIPDHLTLSIDRLPKIELGVDPVELSLRIREFPSLRVHLPADFKVGLALLGFEMLTVRLCGQAMAITEPYAPNPCELCGGRSPDDSGPLTHRLAVGEE